MRALCEMRSKFIEIMDQKNLVMVRDGDHSQAIYHARNLAKKMGFNETDEILIATAASELCVNLIRYAIKGSITISAVHNVSDGSYGVELYSQDEGPGIKDLDMAMKENTTTTLGSLGQGLPSIKRIMDDFHITSDGSNGTKILACKWRNYGENRF